MMLSLLLAQATPPDTGGDLAKALLDAVMKGQWSLAATLAVIAAVWLLRQIPWEPLKTDMGGVLLNFAASIGGSLYATAAAGSPITFAVLILALKLAAQSGGVYTFLKKLLLPFLLKIPVFATLWGLLEGLFSRGDPATVTELAAKKGLAAAVVAKAPKAEDIANE